VGLVSRPVDPQALNLAWSRWLAEQNEPEEEAEVVDLRESA
jgi:hypothetical protein